MEIKEEFEAFLLKKKIDAKAFEEQSPERFKAFANLFGQVHPKSFVQQKLFLLNVVRRRYPLPVEAAPAAVAKKKAARPVMHKKAK